MNSRLSRLVLCAATALLLGACGQQQVRPEPGNNSSIPESPQALRYGPLPEFQPGMPQMHTLANGMRVMLMPDRSLPLVQARVIWPGGSFSDPPGKAGLAELVGASMRSGGTRSRSPSELDAWLEDRAASIETGFGGLVGNASMNALATDLEPMLGLLAEVVFEPRFDAERVELERRSILGDIARQNDEPQGIVWREFAEQVYGPESDPARRPSNASVAAIGLQDLRDFHAAQVGARGMILGLTGDFDPAQTLQMIEAHFGKRPEGNSSTLPTAELGDAPVAGVRYISKQDVAQSNIVIGNLGITRDDPDFHAISVLNEVFGGGSSARLFRRIRSEQGLGYDPGGGIGYAWGYPGMFSVSVSTRVETTGQAIRALLTEIERLISEPPTEAEVERAKTTILNSFVFNSDTPAKVLWQQMHYAMYGFSPDTMSAFREGIEGVSVEAVRHAATRIARDKLVIMVLSPGLDTEPPLDSFGPVSELDISIAPAARN